MTIHALGSDLGIYAGTFVVCFVGGLVPVINAELWVVAVALLVRSPAPLPAVVVLAATGQMLAKCLLYGAARGAGTLPGGRYRARLDAARARFARWQRRPALLLLTSSTVGVPPFYVTALVAGGLGYRLRAFATIGMIGRTARFGTVAALAWAGGA